VTISPSGIDAQKLKLNTASSAIIDLPNLGQPKIQDNSTSEIKNTTPKLRFDYPM